MTTNRNQAVNTLDDVLDVIEASPAVTGIDYVQPDDPGAVGAGKTWLQTKADPSTIWPVWVADATAGTHIIPTADAATNSPNVYYTDAPGASGAVEPVWNIDGTDTTDGAVTWKYAGVIPHGTRLQLWVRNATDSGWLRAGIGSIRAVNGAIGFVTYDGGWVFDSYDANGAGLLEVRGEQGYLASQQTLPDSSKHGAGLGPGPQVQYWDAEIQQNPPISKDLAGSIDPSAGGGYAAPVSSTYRRNNAGTGEFWIKAGAADTAWTKIF